MSPISVMGVVSNQSMGIKHQQTSLGGYLQFMEITNFYNCRWMFLEKEVPRNEFVSIGLSIINQPFLGFWVNDQRPHCDLTGNDGKLGKLSPNSLNSGWWIIVIYPSSLGNLHRKIGILDEKHSKKWAQFSTYKFL